MPRERRSDISIVKKNEWRDVTKKAVYSGLVAALGGYYLLGESGEIQSFGRQMMTSSVVGGSVAVGSVVSDLLSDSVINSLDQSGQMRQVESSLVKGSVCGLATIAGLKISSDINPSITSFLTGGISKFAGDSVYTNFDGALLGMLF